MRSRLTATIGEGEIMVGRRGRDSSKIMYGAHGTWNAQNTWDICKN